MTVRVKLTMVSIAVILVANSIASLGTVRYIGHVWLQEVQQSVRLDLNSAWAAYDNRIESITQFLGAICLDDSLAAALEQSDSAELNRLLGIAQDRGGMDILGVLDRSGQTCIPSDGPPEPSGTRLDNPVIRTALEQQKPVTGTVVLTREALLEEGEELAARARFDLLPTPAARPTTDTVRESGLVVMAAVPILSSAGEMLGLVYGGDLLNRRYGTVDRIKREVFPQQTYEGRDVGTVTIFQGDLRISTNVTREDGSRAVGTRLSDEVYQKVLVDGNIWADRAFVVNDWYMTAYEPIRDPTGKIIGALYVGLLEAPFLNRERVIVGVFLAMMSVTTLTSLALLFFVTQLVLKPISRITSMSRKLIAGDLGVRVGIRPPGEMGALCEAIDAIAEAVAQREEKLKLATRKQIGRTEQMASIGRLAAGIAHEINNPLTGVLSFAHLLRNKPNMEEEDRKDLDVVIGETTRVSEIVRGLLDFARERPSIRVPLDINDVIRRTMRLIRSQKKVEQIIIREELDKNLPQITGDENQLQQVLLNLSLNACESMPGGGEVTISTSASDGNVNVRVTDTGCGISRENLDNVFEPFFTTKPVGKGTGLGLSVSYGIIQQHGGTLEVESEEGAGTTLTIVLPSEEGARPDGSEQEGD